ncbi:MAG: nucleoside-diphosphate kinase [Thermoplasmata archaeon]|nr:nucleoside-diphosphate kinase [Thermoplasmata archaeon]
MARERTFVMVKPDGVQRGLVGEVVGRLERRGLKIVAMKMLWIDRDLAERHYQEHTGKPFFEPLISYITSGPVVAMVVEGDSAIKVVRSMLGKTDPKEASPGTIRGDFALFTGRNVVHGSDSPESAKREISLFFDEGEIFDYRRIDEEWLYED